MKLKQHTFADIEAIEINDIERPEILEEWEVFPDNSNYEISNMGKNQKYLYWKNIYWLCG